MTSSRVLSLAVAGALLLPPAMASGARLDGELIAFVRVLLLLQTEAGEEAVLLEGGAPIVGALGPDHLQPGDRLTVTWTRKVGGVKVAEAVEAEPVVGVHFGAGMPTTVLAEMVAGRRAERATIVDVRSRAAYDGGHVPGAVSLPVADARTLERLAAKGRPGSVVFYGDRRSSRAPIDALRIALSLGWKGASYLEGGLQAWVAEGRPLAVDAAYLERMKPRGAILDVRSTARDGAVTLPGATAVRRTELRREHFVTGQGLPTLVLLGEDGADPEPLAVAELIRGWSTNAPLWRLPRVLLLEGGVQAWRRAGRPLAAAAKTKALRFQVSTGEIDRDEFARLKSADPGPSGPLLLDVRLPGDAPPWGRSIPVDELAGRLRELPRDREIIPYCDLGKQSAIARAILARSGFRVRHLNGTVPR